MQVNPIGWLLSRLSHSPTGVDVANIGDLSQFLWADLVNQIGTIPPNLIRPNFINLLFCAMGMLTNLFATHCFTPEIELVLVLVFPGREIVWCPLSVEFNMIHWASGRVWNLVVNFWKHRLYKTKIISSLANQSFKDQCWREHNSRQHWFEGGLLDVKTTGWWITVAARLNQQLSPWIISQQRKQGLQFPGFELPRRSEDYVPL